MIELNKELADILDGVLKLAADKGGLVEFNQDKFSSQTIGDVLNFHNHGKSFGGNTYRVYDRALDFYKEGGYNSLLEKREENKKLEQMQKEILMLQKNEMEHKDKIRGQESVIRWWKVAAALSGLLGLGIGILGIFLGRYLG